jgi:hypothetical protein
MVEDISPRDSLEHVLYYWWVIALAIITGGLLGWGIGRLSSPVFEARAGYRVSLDDNAILDELHKTNPGAELTYDAKAPYLAPVALAFYTPEVRTAVQEQAAVEGLDFPQDSFRTGQLSLDQHGNAWMVVVRHSDPATAARLANLWISIADKNLRGAHTQAVLALSLKIQIDLLTRCFTLADLAQVNQCAGTSFTTPAEMQASYQGLDQQYQRALLASEGISTLVNFGPAEVAVPPARPVYYNTGLLMLAGGLLGLIIGGMVAQRLELKTG